MQLTGKQIVESGVITGYDTEHAVQQQGLDLRLDTVTRLGEFTQRNGTCGFLGRGWIPAKGKTELPIARTEMELHTAMPEEYPSRGYSGTPYFALAPGYYEITMLEGCKIPDNLVISNIKSRSSLVRCGAEIVCGQFDAGFETKNIGCFLRVSLPICIEHGARIGQVQVFETAPVSKENLYNGQWQHDKQRTV